MPLPLPWRARTSISATGTDWPSPAHHRSLRRTFKRLILFGSLVRLLFGSLFAFIIAALVGLGATYFALTRGAAFGALKIGSWTAWPKTGTADADPYARASIARTGQLPISLGDGVSFSAQTDDAGRVLDGRCDVVLDGVTPAARFWTLTLYNNGGDLVANSVSRYGFTSQEIVRRADGSFSIIVAPRAFTASSPVCDHMSAHAER